MQWKGAAAPGGAGIAYTSPQKVLGWNRMKERKVWCDYISGKDSSCWSLAAYVKASSGSNFICLLGQIKEVLEKIQGRVLCWPATRQTIQILTQSTELS